MPVFISLTSLIARQLRLLLLLVPLLVSTHGYALNILLTNDDGWDTRNINVLKSALESAGHSVAMSAPCGAQSGKGGSMTLFKPIPVDTSRSENNEYCVGDTDQSKSFSDYVDGTPVVAAIYGIDVLADKVWGAKPDLVLSGPNEGNNLGMGNNNSGTLGAAMISMSRGLPAVAVSAHHNSKANQTVQEAIASIVVELIAALEASREEGQPLLPRFTGLNVNLPEDVVNHKGFRETRVGWSSGMEISFAEDMSSSDTAMHLVATGVYASGRVKSMDKAVKVAKKLYAGRGGVIVAQGNSGDDDPMSEANTVASGYISISTINGNVQASEESSQAMKQRLSSIYEQ